MSIRQRKSRPLTPAMANYVIAIASDRSISNQTDMRDIHGVRVRELTYSDHGACRHEKHICRAFDALTPAGREMAIKLSADRLSAERAARRADDKQAWKEYFDGLDAAELRRAIPAKRMSGTLPKSKPSTFVWPT